MKKFLLALGILACSATYAQEVETNPVNSKEIIPVSVLDIMPEYPGGMSAFVSYIQAEIKNHIKDLKGKVFVYFMIDSTGRVSNVEVKRTFNKEIGEKLVEIIEKSDMWQPGSKDGKTVNTAFVLPVSLNNTVSKIKS